MNLTPEQKEHAIELIEMGEKLEAVRYFKETLNITTDEALILAEKLEEEVEGSSLIDEFKSMEAEMKQQPGMDVGRVVGTIFMSLGGIMLAVVVYLSASNYQFSQRAIPVKGKVIDYDTYQSRNDNGGSTTMYTPTYQYKFKGKSYTYKSTTSSSSQNYKIDETVDVLVDPEKPQEILIDSFWEKWFLSILLGFMGFIFSGMGYMSYRLLGNKSSQP